MASRIVSFELCGREVEVLVKPMTTLQFVLRNQLGYTGTKEGCRQGGCGSCTVLVDGEPMMSCLLPVEDVAGRRVTTIEGITPVEGLAPIQQAFVDTNAFQCGYCTPGMVMLTTALLDHNPAPSREEAVEALGGNVCRCTGYAPIIDAIEAASASATGDATRDAGVMPDRSGER
ncbi:MAG: (2Fe-2S)-binding protein [Chloroflexi bacterium]|nr:(2Fe-2S)-binding protein [Chloroflexota bacterium]